MLAHVKLANPTQLPSSIGAVFDNPAATKSYIRGIVLHNTNSTTEDVELQFVGNSGGSLGTPGASNRFLKISIATDETVMVEFASPLILDTHHDAIFGTTTTASKVNFIPLGDQET